jgi:flagellar motor component MotA
VRACGEEVKSPMTATQNLTQLAETLECLTEKTRRQGLHSLEQDLPSITDEALRRALDLVRKGTTQSAILDDLRSQIHAADRDGQSEAEHDRLCFIALGVIALQQGLPTRVIRKLGAGFASR